MFWIGVFGSGTVTPEDPLYEQAELLGKAIAEAGWVVLNGGYGGIMEAVSKGATAADGTVIGVTTPWLKKRQPNPYLSREITAPTYLQRLERLVLSADAAVVFPGGSGTMLEIAALLTLVERRFLDEERPIVFFSDSWRPWLQLLQDQGIIATVPPRMQFVNTIDRIIPFFQQCFQTHHSS